MKKLKQVKLECKLIIENELHRVSNLMIGNERNSLRIEIGPKDLEKNQVTFARRHNRQKDDQAITGLVERVVSELDKIHNDMFSDAKKILEDRTSEVNTYDEFKTELEKGRLIKAPICDNPKCEEEIKEETSADVRVITSDAKDTDSKCIKCSDQVALDLYLQEATSKLFPHRLEFYTNQYL